MSNGTIYGPFRGYYLYDFERNGYHDSDFIVVWYDALDDTIRQGEYDTTRFAGGDSIPGYLKRVGAAPKGTEWPEAAIERFAEYSRRRALDAARSRAGRTESPTRGQRAVFTASYRPRKRKPDRDGVMTPDAEIGDAGTIIWRGHNDYKVTYRNGYNRYIADRDDRVGVALDKGGTVWVSISKVTLEGQATDLTEIGEIADAAAKRARENPRAAGRGTHRSPAGYINAIA